MRCLFDISPHADTGQPAVPIWFGLLSADLRQADHISRHLDALGVIAAVKMLLAIDINGIFFFRHHVLDADFVRFHSDFPGQRIDRHFHRVTDAGARDAAIGHQAGLVSHHGLCATFIEFEIIGSWQVAMRHCPFQPVGERINRIRARIDRDIAIETEHTAIGRRMQRDEVMMFAAIGASHQMFAAVLNPADRAFQLARQPAGDQLFRLQ